MESFLQNRPSLAIAGRFTSPSENKGSFQPFLRPSLVQDRSDGQSAIGEETHGAQRENEPQVEVVNREGCVERIVITCSCCKQIELACEY
jgi:hypothetical protein